MATKFSPCKGSYVLNQFPSNVMFGMNGFHVLISQWSDTGPSWPSCFNPLPDMPILGSSDSAAKKDMSKIWTKWDTII